MKCIKPYTTDAKTTQHYRQPIADALPNVWKKTIKSRCFLTQTNPKCASTNVYKSKERRTEMNTESQNQMVLSHMTKHKTITSMDAFSLYGITRLSARIYDLRERGHKIGMVWEESVNRYGTPVRYGKYFIEKTKGK